MKSTEAPDMPSQSRILVLHGPNLNLLGTREPQHYGADTLDAINARLIARCQAAGFACDTLQSNAEYVLIERIHAANLVNFGILPPVETRDANGRRIRDKKQKKQLLAEKALAAIEAFKPQIFGC